MKVLIVGFGNIGQRHFESIYNYKKLSKIYIFDRNVSKIKKYLNENKKYLRKTVILSNLKEKNQYFLCIISTNSNVRFKIFSYLVTGMKIKNFILEKIIFQNPLEYKKSAKLVEINKLNCWINCPRRTWKIFKEIKKKIKLSESLQVKITGFNWGLMSNAIHFVDLFSYLKNLKNYEVFFEGLEKKIIKTKRSGFSEMKGKIIFKTKNNDQMILEDKKSKSKKSLFIKIKQRKRLFSFYQADLKGKYRIPLQSEDTLKHLKLIYLKKKCELPSFFDTYKIHEFYFSEFKKYLVSRFGKKHKKILIT